MTVSRSFVAIAAMIVTVMISTSHAFTALHRHRHRHRQQWRSMRHELSATSSSSSSQPEPSSDGPSQQQQKQQPQRPKTYSVSFDNPPFFPSTLEELANDVAFAAKVAIVSQILRIRVDVRLRITSRGHRFMLKWLLLMAVNLLDDEYQTVRIYLDNTEDVRRCREIWGELVSNVTATVGPTGSDGVPLDYDRFRDKIQITLLCDLGTALDKGTVCLVFNPDNTRAGELPNLLEDVQALCFHAAWNKLPVILVNPVLLATAWCVVVPCVRACVRAACACTHTPILTPCSFLCPVQERLRRAPPTAAGRLCAGVLRLRRLLHAVAEGPLVRPGAARGLGLRPFLAGTTFVSYVR